jgi:hypothetical protein
VSAGILGILCLVAVVPEGPRELPNLAKPTSITVSIEGDCPSEAAVTTALVPLIKVEPENVTGGTPRVVDLGERFEVTAAGQVGQYTDARRDCSERARVAAVFIALALNPPAFQPRPPAPLAPALPRVDAAPLPPVVRPPPEPLTLPATWARVALGGRVESAPQGGGRASAETAVGVDASAALGMGDFGAAIGAGIRTPTTTHFGVVAVRQQRVPFGIAARVRHRLRGGFELGGEVGLALVLLRLRGEGLDAMTPATRLDVGGRAGVELRLPAVSPRLAPFVILSAEYFPRPYQLEVEPLGRIGSTAPFWYGGTVGLSFQAW